MFRVFFATLLAVCVAAPTQAGGRLFVVSKAKKALQVFDADSGTLEFEITGTGDPHDVVVSPDGRRAYIGDAMGSQNTISVVDVEKRAVVDAINIKPHMMPHGLVMAGDGAKLYATSAPTRAVVEVQLSPLSVTRVFKFFVDRVEYLTISPDDGLVFATSSIDGNLVVLDTAKGEYERSILTGNGSEGLAVSPDGAEVWVANRVSQTVAVIDVAKRKRVLELPCVGNPLHAYVTPDGKEVVVTLGVGDRLVVFDRANRSELTRFEVGDFPVELAFGEKDGPVFVGCAVGNEVAVVDLAGRKVLRRIPCGGDPEGIAFSKR